MIPTQQELEHQCNLLMWPGFDPYALAKYEVLLKGLPISSNMSALIVGCGNGEFAALLAAKGVSVKAIDISPTSIELTQNASKRFHVDIKTEVVSLENFTDSKKYDLVVATDVIEHIQDDQNAVALLKNFCTPKGKIVITVPALSFLFGYHDELLGHYRRYSKQELKNLLNPHMKLETVRYFGFTLIPAAWLISRILRRPYPISKTEKKAGKFNFINKSVTHLLRLEKTITPPLGTSLLAIGSVKK